MKCCLFYTRFNGMDWTGKNQPLVLDRVWTLGYDCLLEVWTLLNFEMNTTEWIMFTHDICNEAIWCYETYQKLPALQTTVLHCKGRCTKTNRMGVNVDWKFRNMANTHFTALFTLSAVIAKTTGGLQFLFTTSPSVRCLAWLKFNQRKSTLAG